MTVPFRIRPASSAAEIMERAVRSLTEEVGLKASTLATTVPGRPAAMRLTRTRGVRPMVAVMSLQMRLIMLTLTMRLFSPVLEDPVRRP